LSENLIWAKNNLKEDELIGVISRAILAPLRRRIAENAGINGQ
jgi:hypothetical protein